MFFRYTLIKYGIENPLLCHPILFTSATGITSFFSLIHKIIIETIIKIYSNPELAVVVGENISEHNKRSFSMIRPCWSSGNNGNYGNDGNYSNGGNSGNRKMVSNKVVDEVKNMGNLNEMIYALQQELDGEDDLIRKSTTRTVHVRANLLFTRNYVAQTLNSYLMQRHRKFPSSPLQQFLF